VTVSEQGVRLIEKGDNSDNYEAWALLQSRGSDAKVRYTFRLYDEEGIQIAEYRDPIVKSVETEVKRRVEWSALISHDGKKPKSVRTYVFDVLENAKESEVPTDSKYGRYIQMILSRNYNPPVINDVSGVQYVVVQLRIARDGRILSLVDGRIAPCYFKRRSANELINKAAERAVIASNPLPPFPREFLIGAQEAVAEIWFRYPK
jgi:TonB-like protein